MISTRNVPLPGVKGMLVFHENDCDIGTPEPLHDISIVDAPDLLSVNPPPYLTFNKSTGNYGTYDATVLKSYGMRNVPADFSVGITVPVN